MGEHKLVPKRDGVKAALLKHTVAQVCLCFVSPALALCLLEADFVIC